MVPLFDVGESVVWCGPLAAVRSAELDSSAACRSPAYFSHRAARAAAAAYRRGMTYAKIAAAMHLTADDVSSWLGPEGAEQS
jgi:hypothetical protein